MKLVATYVSNWDEGEVETTCQIDLMTGDVSDIELSDDHDHFEHHNYDEIQVKIGNKELSATVEDEKVSSLDLMLFRSEAIKLLRGEQS